MKGESQKYCTDCGNLIHLRVEICPYCGIRQPPPLYHGNGANQDSNRWLITLLLCWFVGILGIHRFYTGHTGIGIIQLLTLGGCGIWTLIDLILIIVGNFRDAEGNLIKAR